MSNVLPATGPVAVGGDQGRDFETFHSYLAGSLRFATGFLALAATDTVVFACTLQRDKLKSKIKADVKSICTQGTPVHRIYFFAVETVPVAERHELQSFVHDAHQVKLEIVDGLAIAQLLTDPDVFWIAETYLRLSADMRPVAPPNEPSLPAWYSALKQRWANTERTPVNQGDLAQLVRGLRHATDTTAARPDLPEWLGLIEQFLATEPDFEAAQRARYELSRATLRGAGDLRPAEHHVRAFFGDVASMTLPADLLDASVLLQYTETARLAGESALDEDELRDWAKELRQHLTTLLEPPTTAGRRAGLLNAAAHLSLHFDYAAVEAHEERQAAGTKQHAPPDDDELLSITEVPDWLPLVDIDHGMACLRELVELLPQTPTYPIDSLARHFDMLAPALVDHPLYEPVRSALDEATSRQAGDASTANRCRKRAMSLYRSGRRLAALRELHEAKVNWWHGDTLRGSLLAMLFIARLYGELRMPLAAKKYALSAAFAACTLPDRNVRDLAPAGVFEAASYDHLAGAWMSALRMTRTAVLLHTQVAADPWNMDRHGDLASATVHAVVIQAAVRHRPELAGAVTQLIADAGLSEYVDGVLAQNHTQLHWDEAAWLAESVEQLTGAPFSDAAPIRLIEFGALGQHWRVRFRNERPAAVAAEEFCAAAQVILVELAMADPVLLQTTIEIEVELFDAANEPSERAQPIPDNTCARWKIYLPSDEPASAPDADVETLTILMQILHSSSLLPADKFMAVMEDAFRTGLSHRLTVVNSYRQIMAAFAMEPDSADGVYAAPLGTPDQFPVHTVAELAAPTTAGPGYTRKEAERAIRARYEHSAAATRQTLPRALADEALRAMFTRLLSEGRKEWHLLMALANLALNHRINHRYGPLVGPSDQLRRAVEREELTREERAEDSSPSVAEIAGTFDRFLALAAVSVATTWGLQVNQDTPHLQAVEALLKARYRYWEDDVEHMPFFPPADGARSHG
ncbi:hypothetical protein HC028_17195 [Planosporangium flavigriseum]|uniref:hypothetical protein n=1 Tax=Planosporangium flavigriseum TaxID=373681 RepID=UPI001439B345|nr:hypothetical protein [Planosporangium flavigriseum]NJC66227.1 hypothetical protein [Planosporangium flavigriseum]